MSRHKSYNPERRAWRGRSYKKGGKRVRELRDAIQVPEEFIGKAQCGCVHHAEEGIACPHDVELFKQVQASNPGDKVAT